MAREPSTAKYMSRIIVGSVILALAITVIMQNRRINSLVSRPNNSYSQEKTENYKAEIDKLKSQIADMQSWQNYLENALKEKNIGSISAPENKQAENRLVQNASNIMNNPALRNNLRSTISFRYDSLAEEIGLSGDTKSKLIDLLTEMRLEIMNMMPGRRGLFPEMIDRETLRQQIVDINSKYNEKISELLSPNELYAFKEYQNSEPERMLITGFNRGIIEDNNLLDKEKEKELVAAMYSARQADPDTKREDNTLFLSGRPFGPAQMNGGRENMEKLNSIYLESARNILSEDQMKKFEDYLNTRQSVFNMGRGFRPGRIQGGE